MKIRTKIVTGLLFALSISCLATGCKKKTQETETNTETTRITEKQTESETTKKNTSATFKSKDGSLSIKLPDDFKSFRLSTEVRIASIAFASSCFT